MSSKKARSVWIIPGADDRRAALAVTVSQLAGASRCSPVTTQKVLSQEPTTRITCEKVITGLRALGDPEAMHSLIERVAN